MMIPRAEGCQSEKYCHGHWKAEFRKWTADFKRYDQVKRITRSQTGRGLKVCCLSSLRCLVHFGAGYILILLLIREMGCDALNLAWPIQVSEYSVRRCELEARCVVTTGPCALWL